MEACRATAPSLVDVSRVRILLADDVVAVARKGDACLAQIAKNLDISEGSLANWMEKADIEEGHCPA
jgi:hypothetical protein